MMSRFPETRHKHDNQTIHTTQREIRNKLFDECESLLKESRRLIEPALLITEEDLAELKDLNSKPILTVIPIG